MLIAVRLRGLDMTTEEMDTAGRGHWSATGLAGHDGGAAGGSKPRSGERLSRGCGLRAGGETGPFRDGDGDTRAEKGDEGGEEEAYIGSGL